MPEKIGYLKAIGLDYSFGPTATMEWLLEHVYIYTGLPWWASIATVAVLVRIAIFKPSLTAAQTSHKLQELRKNPQFAAAMQRMQEASFVSGNQAELMEARNELKQMRTAAGVQMWRSFVPMVNLPIAIGMLRLLRGMAALPVPSLETGGVLWFVDLTVPDPFFILPFASSALLYFVMKVCLGNLGHFIIVPISSTPPAKETLDGGRRLGVGEKRLENLYRLILIYALAWQPR